MGPQQKRSLAAVLAVHCAVIGLVIFGAPAAEAATCPAGPWPYYQARSGGCGYGTPSKGLNRLRQPWFKLSGTVVDSAADGSCARVEVKTRISMASDSNATYRVCGKGNTVAISFSDTDTSSGIAGSVQAWSVRICVGSSCGSFRDFKPS